ncbi:MAG: hypothetical protein UT33_C0005G0065 [Candidatus Peregrinibacteria bacterium GW2011_GWC2_39_14]|nr:MAG: hypothetical protein US92_C0001G0065 [Candidatus Peregrinibacteria bacterium GW2011_GWA2_38_36]KKR07121.1 MAG: hypothetical protein UT33_C0005G0065 [Candidatus Peregrinibacteria bacterium GW2011_GWC2_39_14]
MLETGREIDEIELPNSRIGLWIAQKRGLVPTIIVDAQHNILEIINGKSPTLEHPYFTFAKRKSPNQEVIMLEVIKGEDGVIKITQVPGIHDITGHSGEDPFGAFQRILKNGFTGTNGFCNCFIVGRGYMEKMGKVGYSPPASSGKKVLSDRLEVNGDRYRIALWSGFTRNYSHEFGKHGFGYACVDMAPTHSIDPFVVLDSSRLSSRDIAGRVEFYKNELKDFDMLPRVRFLDRAKGYEETE